MCSMTGRCGLSNVQESGGVSLFHFFLLSFSFPFSITFLCRLEFSIIAIKAMIKDIWRPVGF